MKNIILFSFFILSLHVLGQRSPLKKINHLEEELQEISGIEKFKDSNIIWAINDSGNSSVVYGISQKGKIVREVNIENADNIDWEDLAKSSDGTLFIGDFGNNENDREDLSIYIVKDFIHQKEKATATKIEFTFEDQEEFPANKDNRNFGSEAFIYMNHNLYLFTKNRSKNSDGTVNVYKIPAKAGKYKAKKIGSYKTCDDNRHECWITAATINDNENEILLLSEKKIWRLTNFEGERFFEGSIETIIIPGEQTQKESICYKNLTTAFIADEKESKNVGRNLYEFSFSDK